MLLFIIHFQTQLTKTADVKPLEQDLNFVCQYSPKHGIKVRTICYTYLVFSKGKNNMLHILGVLNP